MAIRERGIPRITMEGKKGEGEGARETEAVSLPSPGGVRPRILTEERERGNEQRRPDRRQPAFCWSLRRRTHATGGPRFRMGQRSGLTNSNDSITAVGIGGGYWVDAMGWAKKRGTS